MHGAKKRSKRYAKEKFHFININTPFKKPLSMQVSFHVFYQSFKSENPSEEIQKLSNNIMPTERKWFDLASRQSVYFEIRVR